MIPRRLSHRCGDMLKRILVSQPEKRLRSKEILDHPWLMSKKNSAVTPIASTNRNRSKNNNEQQLPYLASSNKETTRNTHQQASNPPNGNASSKGKKIGTTSAPEKPARSTGSQHTTVKEIADKFNRHKIGEKKSKGATNKVCLPNVNKF